VKAYVLFLTFMCTLFGASATVLLILAVSQFLRRRSTRAALYLCLTLLACIVSAGFYFFRRLI
jgi:Na+/melibiose symporter-like transporter